MTQTSITLFGAGRMGSALAGGWIKAGTNRQFTVIDPAPGPDVQRWADAGIIALNPPARASDILVLAIKPQVFAGLTSDIRSHIGPQTQVISIMAGLTMARLSEDLQTPHVARVMPNTPGLIGKGISTYCLPDKAPAHLPGLIEELLAPLGAVEGPLDETMMGAATGLAGSGPAYIFALTEAMAAAGVAAGFEPDRAMRLARATVEGASALMAASPDTPPEILRQNVTSLGGTTQAALSVLMAEDGLYPLMQQAIDAAIARNRELAEGET